jgi:hypothetical protein
VISKFESFSQSIEQFFLTVGQNNFGNKIPLQSRLAIEKIIQTAGTETDA